MDGVGIPNTRTDSHWPQGCRLPSSIVSTKPPSRVLVAILRREIRNAYQTRVCLHVDKWMEFLGETIFISNSKANDTHWTRKAMRRSLFLVKSSIVTLPKYKGISNSAKIESQTLQMIDQSIESTDSTASYNNRTENTVINVVSHETDPPSCHHLTPFQMHQWRPKPDLTNDQNYMDMVLLLTRNSSCRQGHMACAIVKDPELEMAPERELYNSIRAVGINGSLFTPNDSDIHAEIVTIGAAAKHGTPLLDCTAYITMPPCKHCFGALVSCGISRIVTPKPVLSPIVEVATRLNIRLDTIDSEQCQDRVKGYTTQDPIVMEANRHARVIRQEEKRTRKQRAIASQQARLNQEQKTRKRKNEEVVAIEASEATK